MAEGSKPQAEPGSPKGEDRERVLACFESSRLQQTPVILETLDGVQVEGHVESLDDTKGRMVLSIARAPTAGMRADDEVNLLVSMHENRWIGRAKIHYHNDRANRFTLILPVRLEPNDRRRETRVFLDPSENIKGSLSPEGAEHIQIFGRLSNISENGFRFCVESAEDTDIGKALDPSDVPVVENQILDGVRITGLREEPLDAKGFVVELDSQPLGPILRVQFKALRAPDRSFLQEFVKVRGQAPPDILPHSMPLPPPETDVVPLETPPSPPEDADVETLVASPTPHLSGQRLKRFKTVALVMPPGQEREAMRIHLATEGFTRIRPAGTLAELAEVLRLVPPDLMLVDWPDPPMAGLDIITFLGRYPFTTPPRVILACPQVTTQLAKEANRQGVSHLLVKPYPLDEAFVELLLLHLNGE